ncbi:ABC transporter integral membrane type 1 [Fusarium subglutinans]|uniref:ABC transporter integral membrane type 1 n=1 Tax=Gibberella subglutinans TaxID=42677 RepID=A0A8H5KWP3_GIBSU|nr:ABC transporter integral membrane type 1 [Fusarium subglutinans]KAF5580564.1 ABC transporter integral membrane type 1 [Fusarium subglutinans]
MVCNDNSLGPSVPLSCRGGFDFTLFFQDTILTIIPCTVTILLGVVRLCYLRDSPRKVRPRAGFGPKLIAFAILALLQLALLVLWAVQRLRPSRAALPAGGVELAATLVLGLVSHADHFKTLRPSTLICLYLPLTILLDISRVRTLWLLQLRLPLAPMLTACLCAKVVWLILEARQKQRIVLDGYCDVTEEEVAGILSRSVFGWLLPSIVSGSRKDILPKDLICLDAELRASQVHDAFQRQWRCCPDPQQPHILAWCLLQAFKWQLLRAVLPRLGLLAFTVLQPVIIEHLVEYVSLSDEPNHRARGLGLVAAVALVYGGIAIFTTVYYHSMYRFVAMVRGALICATYQAALASRLSTSDDSSPTLTLISADVDTTIFGLLETHEIWASFVQIGLVMWLLARQVHWGSTAPLVLSLSCVLASLSLFSRLGQKQKYWNESIQVRLGATADMLAHIREIKFLGLTGFFTNHIQGLRAKELETSQKLRRLLVGIVVISRITMTLAPVVTFIIYAAPSNGSLLPPRAFSSLTMIGLLSEPINLLVQAAPGFAGSLGCLDRIQKFMASSHPVSVVSGPSSSETIQLKDPELSLQMHKASFGWKAGHPVLRELSIKIPPRWSVAITGPVACGKSTLLKGILGETPWSSGRIDTYGRSIGYCDQSPWMLNATVRENICGEALPDLARYKRVLHACDLEEDLASLPEGEQTVVGSNAIKLSHGQKQRISLARTLMQKTDLVLVDDVLSGLDEQTKSKVLRQVFGPHGLLKEDGAALLLVTTDNRLLHLFDHVVFLTGLGTIDLQRPVKETEGDVIMHAQQREQRENKQVPPPAGAGYGHEKIQEETEDPALAMPLLTSRKRGDWTLYSYYAAAAGWFNTLVYLVLVAILGVLYNFSTIWLSWWSSANATGSNTAPLSFFSATDIGVLMNHFSEDMQLFDMSLPLAALNTTAFAAICIVQLVVICVSAHWLAATIPACLLTIYLIQRLYLRTSRQVRLLDIELRAPLYRQFLESMRGLVTIRCFHWQESFTNKHHVLLDDSQRAVYMLFCIQRWLALVLDLLVAGMAILLAVLTVTLTNSMSAGAVGLAISNITTFNSNLAAVVQAWTKLETSLGALVRTRTFMQQTPVEVGTGDRITLPPNWPQKGSIHIEDLVASYSPSSPVTLKKISLRIEPGQKVGICGRTGSGKSSLIFSLYRGMHIHSGRILIDDIDLATVPPEEIRMRLSTITQNPLLIRGSARFNLDFTGAQTDMELLDVCRRVGLDEYLLANGGLDAEMSSLTLSPGQTQLFCLARALLQPKQILVLDEVTSNVDHETDIRMRDLIDQEFRGCTIIAIAHRLDFISNYDRVVVLDDGELVEWGSPQTVLTERSLFASQGSDHQW